KLRYPTPGGCLRRRLARGTPSESKLGRRAPGCVVEGAHQLHRDAAVRLDGKPAHVGEHAEPGAIGSHGEQLVPVGIGAEGITGRLEHDGACVPIPHGTGNAASWRSPGETVSAGSRLTLIEVGELALMCAHCIDGEELTVPLRIGTERIGGSQEYHP